MGSFKIEGGRRLKGTLVPQGAKNEALQILCAVLLTSEPVTIHNVPDIVDVNKLIDLLKAMGVGAVKTGRSRYFKGGQGRYAAARAPTFTYKRR